MFSSIHMLPPSGSGPVAGGWAAMRAPLLLKCLDTMDYWVAAGQIGRAWSWLMRAFQVAHGPGSGFLEFDYAQIPVAPSADTPMGDGALYRDPGFTAHSPSVRLWATLDLLSRLVVSSGTADHVASLARRYTSIPGLPGTYSAKCIAAATGFHEDLQLTPDRVAALLEIATECTGIAAPFPATASTLTRLGRHLLRPELADLPISDRLAGMIGRAPPPNAEENEEVD